MRSALSALFGVVEQAKSWDKLGLLAVALLLLPLTLVLIAGAFVQDLWYALVEIYYGEKTPDPEGDRRADVAALLDWACQNQADAAQIEALLEQPLSNEHQARYFTLTRPDGRQVRFAVRQCWDPGRYRLRNGIFDDTVSFDTVGEAQPPLQWSRATFDVPDTA